MIELNYLKVPETSGSNDDLATTSDIIRNAYKEVLTLPDNQELTVEQFDRGKFLLNALIYNWVGMKYFIWKIDFISVAPNAPTIVSFEGQNFRCIQTHTSSLNNTPSSRLSLSFWTQDGEATGIEYELGKQYVSGKEIFLDPNIISVQNARRKSGPISTNSGNTIMGQLSREEYFFLNNTDSGGSDQQPTQWYFQKDHLNTLFIFPVPSENQLDFIIELDVNVYPQSFTDIGNNPDFLREWRLPLFQNLALELAGRSSISSDRLDKLEKKAEKSLANAQSANNEIGDMQITPFIQPMAWPGRS